MDGNYDVITFISKYLYFKLPFFRRPRVANFADIFKISPMFTKTSFKDLKKIKTTRNYVLKRIRDAETWWWNDDVDQYVKEKGRLWKL